MCFRGSIDRPSALDHPPPFNAIADIIAAEDLAHFGADMRNITERSYNFYLAYGALWRPRRVLEIGVRRGYAGYSIALGSGRVEQYVGLDCELDIEGSNGIAADILRRAAINDIKLYKVDTQVEFPSIDGTFDLIHIDADHSMAGAFSDLCNAMPLLATEGVAVIDDFSSPPVAAAIRAYLKILGSSAEWFSVRNLRSQAIICRPDKSSMPRNSISGFAQLPDWAKEALEITAQCGAVRALSALPDRHAALTMSTLAHDSLSRIARRLELSDARRALPNSPLVVLSQLSVATAEICASLEARIDHVAFVPARAVIREHLIYVASRAAIPWPEQLGECPKERKANFGPASPETIALLREFSAHVANFVDSIVYRLV